MAGKDTVIIPGLGEVQGTYDPETKTTKFLGIPYGSVSKRWTRATALAQFSDRKHDGTKFGPICPQKYSAEMPSLIQMSIPSFPSDPVPTFDEFQCLNLNILKPDTDVSGLPVMVWIHGGGFGVGSNTESIYDGVEFVTTSAKNGNPVIHVAINYRLGPFGFLSSNELLEENRGKAVGNYGLWDQRLALEFVQKHISAFGGDPSKVTIFGESAGAASVHSHVISQPALCHSAILQSGSVRTLGPVAASDPYQTGLYARISENLGHSTPPSPETLRQVPAQDLIATMTAIFGNSLALGLITDDSELENGFFPKGTDWVTPQPWLKRLMTGDCAVEGVIMVPNMMRIAPPDLVAFLNSEQSLPQSVLANYGLDNLTLEKIPTLNPPLMPRLINLETAAAFFGPGEDVISKAKPESTWIYRLNRPNKWGPGVFANIAHHTIDLLYLGGVPKSYPTAEPEIDIALGEAMVQHWVDFVVGKAPWQAAGTERVEMVYGEDGTVGEKKSTEQKTRDFENVESVKGEGAEKALRVNLLLATGLVYPQA